MSAYVIGNESIHDPEGFGKYAQAAGPTVVQYGGKLLAAGPQVEVLEGEPNPVTVIMEFESVEAAKRWYNSPEYQAVVGLRHAAATGWLIIAEEFVPPQG